MATKKGRGRTTDAERAAALEPQDVLSPEQASVVAFAARDEHYHSKKTTNAYKSTVKRGKEFLKSLVDSQQIPEGLQDYDKAFSKPIEASPIALLQFTVNYLSKADYKYSTAEQIRSSFKDHFRNLGCQGNYWKDDGNGGYVGNPVFDPTFNDYIKSLKNKDGRIGNRSQSLAMSYKHLSALMLHLQHPATIQKYGKAVCLMFEAFAATAFTIWTRYFFS